MEFNITFLGTAASVPSKTRGLPAILMQIGGDLILFDCGEGTQRQMVQAGVFQDLDAIFISHLHVDHWFGLVTILKSFELRERSKPLTIYGPSRLIEKMGAAKIMTGPIDSYPITYVEFDSMLLSTGVLRDGYAILPFKVDHRARCYGFVIQEDEKPGRVDVRKANELGIHGHDIGKIQRGGKVNGVGPEHIMGEPRRGRKVVYTGDTRPCENVIFWGNEADVLIHEATFLDSESTRAAKVGHSTVLEAANILKACKPTLGVLTHIGARYSNRDILNEARICFPEVKIARDFDVIEVPLPDKGRPIMRSNTLGGV